MRAERTGQLLPPARSEAVRDALRSPSRSLHEPAEATRSLSSATLGDVSSLTLTSPHDDCEQDARRAESGLAGPMDYSHVRVHTDPHAARAAALLGAKAFTVGPHIVFGAGRYSPGLAEGRRLLAHELRHATQPGNRGRIALDPVTGYETKGIELDRTQMETLGNENYWEQKVFERYATTYVNTVTARFKADVEERDAVLSVLWSARPKTAVTAEVAVTASIPPRANRPKSKALLYTFTFQPPEKPKGKERLRVAMVGEGPDAVVSVDPTSPPGTAPVVGTPPSGYAGKHAPDVELEKAQGAKAPADRLGQLKNLDRVPADEQLSVKFAIWQYFTGGTRNREVDAIIPIANKTTSTLYTFRFQPKTNDVEIERVGQEGASVALSATALDVSRVEGFTANAADVTTLKAWLSKRYPSIQAQGSDVAELQTNATKEMVAKSSTPEWFKTNYGIEILDSAAAEARLAGVHKLSPPETAGLKAFAAPDLLRLEAALQTMSEKELAIVRGTRMARQDAKIRMTGSGKARMATPDPATGGFTWQTGSEKTIVIFDAADQSDRTLFVGGSSGVRSASTATYAHELGHVLGHQAELEAPFNAFVRKKKIKPITWYAAKDAANESFPEAYALFLTDPEWMRNNLPELFAWFTEVKKTGKAPPP